MYITYSNKIEINTIYKVNDFIKHLDKCIQNYADSHNFSFYKVDKNTREISISTPEDYIIWYSIIYNINYIAQTLDISVILKDDDSEVKTISIRTDELSNENMINIIVSHIDDYIN